MRLDHVDKCEFYDTPVASVLMESVALGEEEDD